MLLKYIEIYILIHDMFKIKKMTDSTNLKVKFQDIAFNYF
jgi:hypothetical protein